MRKIEPVYFPDLYDSLESVLDSGQASLPKTETYLLVESMRGKEHVERTLELFLRERRDKGEISDNTWHFRKRWYLRLSERACDLAIPEVALKTLEYAGPLQILPSYGSDLVRQLGNRGVSVDILLRAVDLVKKWRGAKDKAVRSTYIELLVSLMKRKRIDQLLRVYNLAKKDGVALDPNMTKYLDKLEQSRSAANQPVGGEVKVDSPVTV